MAKPSSLRVGDINLTAGGEPTGPERPEPDTPFRILLLGNFSGRTAPGSLADRRPVLVDRDNFDEVLARFNVTIRLPPIKDGGGSIDIRVKELDDFHPDHLFQELKVFEALRGLRRRLANPASFAAAAAEVRGWAGAKTPAAPAPKDRGKVARDIRPQDLLDQMLGLDPSERPPEPAAPASTDWNAVVQQIMQPYVVPGADPQQPELVARVDEATGAHMRALLHHPSFQAVEAAWRAVYFLVRRLETDRSLKVYLLDVARDELVADLVGKAGQRTSAVYKLLVEQTVGTQGGQPWAVIAGNYTFEDAPEDVMLLLRMARLCREAGTPFLAGTNPIIFGCESLGDWPDPDYWHDPPATAGRRAWETLRRLPEAAYLGLAVPRFLLRLPYGKDAGTADQFRFEEFPDKVPHEQLLWGNPAFACTLLLGQAFTAQGWDLRPGSIYEIDGLPAFVTREDGDSQLKPCAEALLTDRAVARIVEAGIMPLRSVQGSDVIRLAQFLSLASPPAPVAGRWGQ